MKNDNVVIFSTLESSYFANMMSENMGIPLIETERKIFGGGEEYLRLMIGSNKELIDKTAIIVGSTHTDQAIFEMYKVGSALRTGFGTKRRIFVILFFGYSTMERATKPGEIVTAKIIARMFSGMPGGAENYFFFLDLHAPGIAHYFEGDCMRYEVSSDSVLIPAMRELEIANPIFASADLGRPIKIQNFAESFGASIALISKQRNFEETKILHVIGDVVGKSVIIYDDMTRSAGTIIKAVKAYLEHGAKEVFVVLSHFAANDGDIITSLIDSPVKKIIITDSHPMSQHELVKTSEKFKTIKVAKLFADEITPLLPKAA